MVDQVETSGGSNFISRLFDTVFSLVLVFLIAVGLISVTAKWESSQIEFVGVDGLKVSRSTWWGLIVDETSYRPSLVGWVQVNKGNETPVNQRPVVLNF